MKLLIPLALLSLSSLAPAQTWHHSPINGHWYARTTVVGNWLEVKAQANDWGGHLATVRSAEEDAWLMGLFTPEDYWIGFSDAAVEGTWVWCSGEPVTYTNWAAGEPNNQGDEDYCAADPINGGGNWNDGGLGGGPLFGVVELISSDCNGNLVPDSFEIIQDPALDWNGDGVLDICDSANFCVATPNSKGLVASISASGSPLAVHNTFTLEAVDLPCYEFGYFLASESTAFVPRFGGSDGNLCLGAPQYRFNNPSDGGQILNSRGAGTMSFTLDLTGLPQGITFDPGETWYFQLWFRDFTTAPTSNTTDGIEVMFR